MPQIDANSNETSTQKQCKTDTTRCRNYEKKKQMQEFIDKKKEELLAKQNEENKK